MLLPIKFSTNIRAPKGTTILTADIGGTKTHLALFEVTRKGLWKKKEAIYGSKDYNSFVAIVKDFCKGKFKSDRISIGFAGPVYHGKAVATNLNWTIDVEKIKAKVYNSNVFLINDLEAHAYGLAALKPQDIFTLHPGQTNIGGNAAIIAPGTGLGEAGLYWDGNYYHPFATEGGHSNFGPQSEVDAALLKYLHQKWEHVSWERLVSGEGIFAIYSFLCGIRKTALLSERKKQIKVGNPAIAISEGAKQGCPVCREAFDFFWKYLAIESANLVLKLKATGGLFIGGGIVPKNLDLLDNFTFLNHFYNAGRMRPLLEKTPIHIIRNEDTALLGAAYYALYSPVTKTHSYALTKAKTEF